MKGIRRMPDQRYCVATIPTFEACLWIQQRCIGHPERVSLGSGFQFSQTVKQAGPRLRCLRMPILNRNVGKLPQ